MAEGIAGSTPRPRCTEEGIGMSLLMELCEDGQQLVKVTKLHKRNTELMFPEENAGFKYLDDYVSPPAPANTFVTWSTRYLAEKDEEA